MYISCTEEGHRTAAHTHGVLYTVIPLHYALFIAMLTMVVRKGVYGWMIINLHFIRKAMELCSPS